jgi:hypothetical protein
MDIKHGNIKGLAAQINTILFNKKVISHINFGRDSGDRYGCGTLSIKVFDLELY